MVPALYPAQKTFSALLLRTAPRVLCADPKEALELLRTTMNIGDKVKVSRIPADLPKDNATLQKLFKGCLGKTFTIAAFDGDLVELHVGEAFGEAPEKHQIWLEPEYLRHVEADA
jgi:hypothetical protein